MPEMSTEMYTKIELTYDELFLIEMAIEEALYKINDTKSPISQRLILINMTLYETRKRMQVDSNKENKNEQNV